MARNGDQDDEFYSEPTQYANYGGSSGQAYSEVPGEPDYGYQAPYPTGPQTGYGQPAAPEPPNPWHRNPAVLVLLGALAALVIALLIYLIVQLSGGSSSTTETTTTTPTTTASVAPAPGQTETVTETPTATEAPTQTEAPETTTAETTTETTTLSPSVSTSTVTQTETETVTTTSRPFPNLPTFFPRPGGGDGQ